MKERYIEKAGKARESVRVRECEREKGRREKIETQGVGESVRDSERDMSSVCWIFVFAFLNNFKCNAATWNL